jgi:hypothetical protein
MKRLLEDIFCADPWKKQQIIAHQTRRFGPIASADKQLFDYCFPNPGRILKDSWQFSSEELVAIASVYLLINQSCYFEDWVTMTILHDAIWADFSERFNDSTMEFSRFFNLTKNNKTNKGEQFNYILSCDILLYYDLYQIAVENNHPATCEDGMGVTLKDTKSDSF